MKFYGQQHILKEVFEIIVPTINNGNNLNLMLIAPSGHGKSTLGLLIVKEIGVDNFVYYVPDGNGKIRINKNYRTHFIDEAHTLENQEILYHLMDKNEYVFIFASNETGSLKEPLRNRCIPLMFKRYVQEDLEEMVFDILRKYNLNQQQIKSIASRGRLNPRVIKILCQRLSYIFEIKGFPKDNAVLEYYMDELLKIKSGGYTVLDELYISYLKEVRNSSLDNLSNTLGIDRNTILRDIEPFLLEKGEIKITSRGRIHTGEIKW